MKIILLTLTFILYASIVYAEQITVNYTEPTASATLAHTTVYWCRGATCTNYTVASKQVSDDGNGGDAKSIPINVPLTAGTLPLTIRVRVTATDTSGNETAGATSTHTFN